MVFYCASIPAVTLWLLHTMVYIGFCAVRCVAGGSNLLQLTQCLLGEGNITFYLIWIKYKFETDFFSLCFYFFLRVLKTGKCHFLLVARLRPHPSLSDLLDSNLGTHLPIHDTDEVRRPMGWSSQNAQHYKHWPSTLFVKTKLKGDSRFNLGNS